MRTLVARLQYDGGDQLGRIQKDKLRSLRSALNNSYNSRTISTPTKEAWKCLINTNKLTADYDRKILSVEKEAGLEPGDTFEVLDDGTRWMVFLQILTETAYLKADIVRCNYYVDIDGARYWIYFQGPSETTTQWITKKNIQVNELNLSGTLYIKKDPVTDDFITRFNRLSIGGRAWQIKATDRFSVPGIIQAVVDETFTDETEDLPKIVMECPRHQIIGPTSSKNDVVVGYEIGDGYKMPDGIWWIEDNPRVEIEKVLDGGTFCRVKVHDGAIGSFRVKYGKPQSSYYLDVRIECCEPSIDGPTEIYPYDRVEYKSNVGKGSFFLQTDKAKIIDNTSSTCMLEVSASRACSFTLYFNSDDGICYEREISVKSL